MNHLPNIDKFNRRYYQINLLNLIIFIAFYILFVRYTYAKLEFLFYLATFYAFLMIASRIELIKSLIIKRIGNYLKENTTSAYTINRTKETIAKIIVAVSIITLFRILNTDPQIKFYLIWAYAYLALSSIVFMLSHNIYKYFINLINSLIENTSFKEYRSEVILDKDQIIPDLQSKIKRLKSTILFSLCPVAIASVILIYFKKQSVLAYSPVPLIVALGITVLDIDKSVRTALSLLEQYDSFGKRKP